MSNIPLLPVPDLVSTQQHYLATVRPFLSEGEYDLAEQEITQFCQQEGQTLHQALIERSQKNAHSSWLIDDWLNAYLRIRSPLPLTSNVGFEIQTKGYGIADWTAALAAVCADHHHQRIVTPLSTQGTPMCMSQWRILRGAARVPQSGCDSYRFAENSRHIGVWYRGFYYRVLALDEQHEVLSADSFRQAFAHILSQNDHNPYPVALPCYLGGDETAHLYNELRQNPYNAELLNQIENDLFHIGLDDTDTSADENLAHATFLPDAPIWCYKPLSFIYYRANKRLFLHCEHTWEDGGMLKGLVVSAAEKLPNLKGNQGFEEIQAQTWQLNNTQQHHWLTWQHHYREQAEKMRVMSVLIPFDGRVVPQGISHDALMQWQLQYAQRQVYPNIRNTYEAVDVSHFQSGRTECVRPVSVQSIAFIESLCHHQADKSLFQAALLEHKNRIKIAKQGLGANRHLWGLQQMAKRLKLSEPALFKSDVYQCFTQDFFSTSTLGDDAVIRNFAFAPTVKGGLGINYTFTPQGWLFTIGFHEAQHADVLALVSALKEGGKRLLTWLVEG